MTAEERWYKRGLRFKCTGCGGCCTGSPGVVWVSPQEMQAIADFLNLPLLDFTKRYVRKVEDRYSLVELKKNYDCVFLKDKKCQIYPVRPTQCRTFPWWPHLLESPEAWKEASLSCEGICDSAPVVSVEEIESQCLIQLASQKKNNA